MTNPDRDELVKLAETIETKAEHIKDYRKETGVSPEASCSSLGSFVASNSSTIVTALRRLASSEGGVKGEPEPVAWRYRPHTSSDWLATTKYSHVKCMEQYAEIEPLYLQPVNVPTNAGMRKALAALEGEASAVASAQARNSNDVKQYIEQMGPAIIAARVALGVLPNLTAPGATTKSDDGESFVTTNPDGSVTLDAYAGKSRDELKARCRELCQHLNEWQFIAMEAATAHGNCLSNVPENARTKIANMIEAYRDDDEPGPSDPSSTGSDVTVDELAREIWLACFRRAFSKEPTDPWENQGDGAKAPHLNTARALLDQFEIRRK